MPRNRSKRKSSQTKRVPEQSQQVVSPSSAIVIERIANYEGDYLEDNFARILIDSYELAVEPEFIDLTFPPEKTLQATEKTMDKYGDRLEAAEQEDDDEAQPALVDQMRIEIIQQIATPYVRKEVTRRLERLLDRLMAGDDPERFETALVTSQIMKLKEIPWGVVGLILAIYQRTLDQELEDLETAEDLMGELLAEIQKGRDPVEVIQEDYYRERAERFIQKLETDQELSDKVDREANEDLKEFEMAILKGELSIPLFSEEELAITLRPLEESRDSPEDVPDLTEESQLKQLILTARQSLREFLTPERLQEIKVELSGISSEYLREGKPWSAYLMAGVFELDELPVENQRLLLLVYIRQLLDSIDGFEAQE